MFIKRQSLSFRMIVSIVLLTFVFYETSPAISLSSFNPVNIAKKAFKCTGEVTDSMWKFKPSHIGEKLPPFEWGMDVVTRGTVLGMKLRRAIMKYDFGLTDVMTLYGYEMYRTGANIMPGDYEDKVMIEMTKVILSNDELTKEFIKEALKYEGMAKFMHRLAEKDKSLLDKMASLMAKNKDIAELLLKMALKYDYMAELLINNMNDYSFSVLTLQMSKSKEITRLATKLFKKLGNKVFSENSKFGHVFFNPENGYFVEKMIYSVLKDEESTENFLAFFKNAPQDAQIAIVGYLLDGRYPDGTINQEQSYYFTHAIIKGLSKGDGLEAFSCDLIPSSNVCPNPCSVASELIEKLRDPKIIPIIRTPDDIRFMIQSYIQDKYKNCNIYKQELVEKYLNKFLTVLITGAYIYHDEDYLDLLNEFQNKVSDLTRNLPKSFREYINNLIVSLMPQPDPAIPPSRVDLDEHINVTKDFKLDKDDEVNVDFDISWDWDDSLTFNIKGDWVYKEDIDKWLTLPYWLAPAHTIELSNKEKYRNISQCEKVGTIEFKTHLYERGKNEYKVDEYVVVVLVSQYAPYPVWLLKEGFVPIDSSNDFVESEKQTGWLMFGKVVKGGEKIDFYGNGGGEFNYAISILKGTKIKQGTSYFPINPLFIYAKNKVLNSNVSFQIGVKDGVEYVQFPLNKIKTILPNNNILFADVEIKALERYSTISTIEGNKIFLLDRIHQNIIVIKKDDYYLVPYTLPKIDEDEKILKMIKTTTGKFAIITDDKKVYISDNSNYWNEIKISKRVYDIAYGNGKFVAAGEDGRVVVIDENTYDYEILDKSKTKTKGKDILDVEFINGTFYLVGEDGRVVATSNPINDKDQWAILIEEIDLRNYLNIEDKIDFSFTRVKHIPEIGKYILLTDNGLVFMTTDIENPYDLQIKARLDSMTPLTEIAYNPNSQVLAIVGLNGVILTSINFGETWDDFKLEDDKSFVEVIPNDNEEGFTILSRNGQIVKFVPYTLPNNNTGIPQGGCSFAPQANILSGMMPTILVILILIFRRKFRH